MERSSSLVPGFRFHPTDPELVMYYLKRKILGKKIIVNAVAEVNIYDFSPWDLPDKSSMKSGDLKWYFFCPKARKYTSGSRANRATESGFWKATGKDRTVKYKERTVATIKTLVFHLGHAGNGQRTDWVMHEYKMEDQQLADQGIVQDTYVLCIVFKKDGAGPKNGAQYGAPFNEEEWDDELKLEKGPVSSTVTFCANETAKNKQKNKIVNRSACGLSITEPGSGSGISTVTYETGNCKQKGSATTNTVHLMSLTEPCSASGTSANDDVMYYEDFATLMGVSTEDLNGNNNKNKGVEVDNTKEGKDIAPNEDDGIFDDLVNLMNLDDMNRDASNMFNTDEAYMLNTIMEADDLDVNLGKFCVD